MGRRFTYKKRSYDDARKRAEQSSGARDSFIADDISLWKPSEGDNTIRILPPGWDDANHYGIDLYVHYGIGPDNAAYLCLDKMKGEPCPVCEERLVAENEGDKDYSRKLKPTKRVLFYLLDRDKQKDGVKAWAAPWTIDKEIMIQSTDSRTNEYFPVDDPEEGFDIRINRTGSTERTEYSVVPSRRASSVEITPEIEDYILDRPLPEILVYYAYDHIAKVFSGTASAGGGQSSEPPSRSAETSHERQREVKKETKAREPELTYEEVMALKGDQLDELVDDLGLDLDPGNFDGDEDLAEAICDTLGLEKPKPKKEEAAPSRRRRIQRTEVEKEDDNEEGEKEEAETSSSGRLQSKLAELRNRRKARSDDED